VGRLCHDAMTTALFPPNAPAMDTPSLQSHDRPPLPRLMTNTSRETQSAMSTPVPLSVKHHVPPLGRSPSITSQTDYRSQVYKEQHSPPLVAGSLSLPKNNARSLSPQLSSPQTCTILEKDPLHPDLAEHLEMLVRQERESMKEEVRKEGSHHTLRNLVVVKLTTSSRRRVEES